MIFTKSLICKLLLLTLLICCLTASATAAKIPKAKTKAIATNATVEVTTEKAQIVAASEKDSDGDGDDDEDDNDDDDDDDDEDDDDGDGDSDVSSDASASDESNTPAEKNAIQPSAPSALSVWGIVGRVWNWIKADLTEGLFGEDDTTAAVGEGRTFGKIRRLQMALIPIVFKFGVLTAMVAFLVAIALKTLFFIKVLLLMNGLALLGKFFTLKSNLGHYEHVAPHPPPPAWGWSPHSVSSWSEPAAVAAPEHHHPSKEIHLHIHGAQGVPQVQSYSTLSTGAAQPQGWQRRSDPYSAYGSLVSQDQNDLSTTVASSAPMDHQVSVNYPPNHRMF